MKKPNLGILLKPVSHDCNMACDYCYYRPVAGLYPDAPRPRMSLDVVDAVCEQYLRLEPQEIKLGWQGGEPTLMGLDFYRRVVEVEKRRARPGDCFGNSLQTNGVVLDEEWCSFLAANRFLVGLSLDGPAELNAVRRFPNGRPAFDAAERALSLLKAHRVEFNVLVVISRANVAHPDRIFRFLVENDLHYAQFIPCTEPAGAPRQVTDLSVSPDAYAEFMIGLFDAWAEQDDPAYYVRRIDNYLHQFFGLPAECCEYRPECSNLLTVEWNGDVYPCDFFVEERYRLGNVGEQTLEQMLRGEAFRSFARQAEALPAVCDGCPWLSCCHGGCYRHRAKLGIGADEPPYLCEANKRIFAHVFERLRFLKDEAADRRLHAFLNRIGQDVAAGRLKGGPHTPGPARRGALSRGGPRSPQRNDLCPCGSGRKYKHCCGKAVGLSHRSP